ncbi:MAG: MAPEG family protein [Undibacterium sp.]
MILPVTTTAASILTALYGFLTLRVISMRRRGIGPAVGLNENESFIRAVRAHANFAEYTPLFLILLGLNEIQDGSWFILFGSTILFVAGRFLHAIGFGLLGTGPGRVIGMVGTNTALFILALANIVLLFS